MTSINYKFYAMIIVFFAFLGTFASQASAKDINGFYIGDAGRAHYLSARSATRSIGLARTQKVHMPTFFQE